MEVLAVRNELANVKAQLINAQNELAIEKELRAIDNDAAANAIQGLQGEVASLTCVVASLKSKIRKGVVVFVCSIVVVAGVGTGVAMQMGARKGNHVYMLMG